MGDLRWFEVMRGRVKHGDVVHGPGEVFQERPEDRFGPLLDAGRIRVAEAPAVRAVAETNETPSVTEAATGEVPTRAAKRRGAS